jgi:hypothetical protein
MVDVFPGIIGAVLYENFGEKICEINIDFIL